MSLIASVKCSCLLLMLGTAKWFDGVIWPLPVFFEQSFALGISDEFFEVVHLVDDLTLWTDFLLK